MCIELQGSFSCSCYSGYELQEDNANCAGSYNQINYLTVMWYILHLDIDECARGLAGCSDNCINTPGSFTCTCMDGFELVSDNLTCAGDEYVKIKDT